MEKFGEEGVYTEDLRWLRAWRIWNDYDDKHTKDLEEKGEILKKADSPGSDKWDKDFQGDMGG